MKTLIFLVVAALCCIALPSAAQSVPALINYQGQIQNPDGTAPPTADYTLTFRIYDAAVGGSVVWGPQVFDGVGGAGHGPRIPVVQGYFNVMLGPTDTAARSLASAFDASSRFIEVTVSNRPPVAPRQQLLSAPFSLKAGDAYKLVGYDWGSLLSENDPVNGKLHGSKIAANSVTGAQMANQTITASQMAPNTITANQVAGGAIGGAQVADSSVAVNHLTAELIADAIHPPGTVIAWMGTNAVAPTGWEFCWGQTVSRTDPKYTRLFGVIGISSGNGNGTTTFSLPDLRAMFLRGVNGGRSDPYTDQDSTSRSSFLGGNAGNQVGSVQLDAFARHTHASPITFPGINPANQTWPGTGSAGNPGTGFTVIGANNGNVIAQNNAYSGTSEETHPRNVYVQYLIKL